MKQVVLTGDPAANIAVGPSEAKTSRRNGRVMRENGDPMEFQASSFPSNLSSSFLDNMNCGLPASSLFQQQDSHSGYFEMQQPPTPDLQIHNLNYSLPPYLEPPDEEMRPFDKLDDGLIPERPSFFRQALSLLSPPESSLGSGEACLGGGTACGGSVFDLRLERRGLLGLGNLNEGQESGSFLDCDEISLDTPELDRSKKRRLENYNFVTQHSEGQNEAAELTGLFSRAGLDDIQMSAEGEREGPLVCESEAESRPPATRFTFGESFPPAGSLSNAVSENQRESLPARETPTFGSSEASCGDPWEKETTELDQKAASVSQQTSSSSQRVEGEEDESSSSLADPELASGVVYTWGSCECDQLAVSEALLNDLRALPTPHVIMKLRKQNVVRIACGALHSAALLEDGTVVTWGCNDSGALGQKNEAGERIPARVKTLPSDEPVVAITCGDSHTGALTKTGRCFLWGCYRDSNGAVGFPDFKKFQDFGLMETLAGEKAETPVEVTGTEGVGIALKSGEDHTLLMTVDASYVVRVYSWGSNDFGQLAREPMESRPEDKVSRLARRVSFLFPAELTQTQLGFEPDTVTNVFCGKATSFLETRDANGFPDYFAAGRNSCGELGLGHTNRIVHRPEKINVFSGIEIEEMTSCQYASVALTEEGVLFTWGDGRYLGRGNKAASRFQTIPEELELFGKRKIVNVGTGSDSMFVTLKNGQSFSWGEGQSYQLGTGCDYSDPVESPLFIGDGIFNSKTVLKVIGGSQHSIALVYNGNSIQAPLSIEESSLKFCLNSKGFGQRVYGICKERGAGRPPVRRPAFKRTRSSLLGPETRKRRLNMDAERSLFEQSLAKSGGTRKVGGLSSRNPAESATEAGRTGEESADDSDAECAGSKPVHASLADDGAFVQGTQQSALRKASIPTTLSSHTGEKEGKKKKLSKKATAAPRKADAETKSENGPLKIDTGSELASSQASVPAQANGVRGVKKANQDRSLRIKEPIQTRKKTSSKVSKPTDSAPKIAAGKLSSKDQLLHSSQNGEDPAQGVSQIKPRHLTRSVTRGEDAAAAQKQEEDAKALELREASTRQAGSSKVSGGLESKASRKGLKSAGGSKKEKQVESKAREAKVMPSVKSVAPRKVPRRAAPAAASQDPSSQAESTASAGEAKKAPVKSKPKRSKVASKAETTSR